MPLNKICVRRAVVAVIGLISISYTCSTLGSSYVLREYAHTYPSLSGFGYGAVVGAHPPLVVIAYIYL